MRSFPSALSDSPARRLAVVIAGSVALGCLSAPVAVADHKHHLRHKQHQVEGQIHRMRGDLDEASKEVAQSVRHLNHAVTRLNGARKHLQHVRSDLWDARAERERLARRLTRAQDRFERVTLELNGARADLARQRELVRNTVLHIETHGNADLAVMNALTSSGSIQQLLVARTAGGMILGREDQTLTDYQAAEDELADWKAQVREARDAVAQQKLAAQRNLLRIRGLFADARDTRAEVAQLVGRARHARKVAVHARKRDRASLERLKGREARIKKEILALTRKHSGPTYSGSTGGLLHIPTEGPVTSPFGWRIHPIYGYWGLHNGTDFGAPCGAPLWAGESGTVINEYYDEVYGNRLYLSIGMVNGANITLVYNHMSSYSVSEGAHVSRGQVVGHVGETGWATGCHLHFIVMKNGVPVDPMGYL